MSVKRPIMRYHGGKWILAPWIISNFKDHRVYCEPFGGAASVLLRKPRSYAEIYNDLDGEIVNVFKVARDHGPALKELLFYTPFARADFDESYQKSNDPLEQARRTIARTFMGFGSNAHNKKTGFRRNSNRSGTTPAHDWKNYAECFDFLIERLRGVVIENKDAMDVMGFADGENTLHYVDPPYVFSTRGDGRDDYKYEMCDTAHDELADFLKSLKGMVLISGYQSELYDTAFKDFQRIEKQTHADGAKKRTECLWLNSRAKSTDLFNQ